MRRRNSRAIATTNHDAWGFSNNLYGRFFFCILFFIRWPYRLRLLFGSLCVLAGGKDVKGFSLRVFTGVEHVLFFSCSVFVGERCLFSAICVFLQVGKMSRVSLCMSLQVEAADFLAQVCFCQGGRLYFLSWYVFS